MRKIDPEHKGNRQSLKKEAEEAPPDEHIVRDFSSRHGRLYHFILSWTPEGRLATSR
ncbi:hypothetical protein IWW55_007294 [Coemansia sp. RSA 2706]|nr:hypothetical protein IWW55_007294 [Coemansia sp. RSA 2706]